MASNVCKSSCACAHEFNRSICTVVARPEFVFMYTCCIIARVEWLVIACIFIRVHLARDYCVYVSATVWQRLTLQLYFANVLSALHANALLLHTCHVVFIVPRFWIKRLLLEMPERAKLFAFACMLTLIVNWFGKLHIRVFWAAL